MKYLLTFLVLLTVIGGAGTFFVAKQLYRQVNQVRLDPLQLTLYPGTPAAKASSKPRLVFFGDSRALSWPVPDIAGFEFLNRGIGQQTSEQIRLRYDQHVAPLNADILVLQLCVNDLKAIPLVPQQHQTIVAQCQSNTREIIAKARQQGSRVILTTIFPLGTVPLYRRLFWSDAVAQAINTVNADLATLPADGIELLDSFSLLGGSQGNQINPDYSRDLLHLNDRGYAVLNEALQQHLTKR